MIIVDLCDAFVDLLGSPESGEHVKHPLEEGLVLEGLSIGPAFVGAVFASTEHALALR